MKKVPFYGGGWITVTHWWTGVCSFSLIFPFFIILFFVFPENSNHLKSLSKCSEKSERVYSAMRDANLESLLVIF